jgi:hypothetical protein
MGKEAVNMDMKLTAAGRWQDWGNLALGAWLFISPWVMLYQPDAPNAIWNAHILGAAIVILSAFAVYMPRIWEEGLNAVYGIWAIASPWVLGFSTDRNVTANTVIVGILVAALAAWATMRDKSFEKWREDHRAAH